MLRIRRRYDAVLPDEAPAGVTPEPPPWLMASTGRPSRRSPAINRWLLPGHTWQERQLNVYYVAAIWLGMALLASMVSIWIAVPAALVEIVIGALAGNIPGIQQHVTQTGFVTFLASVGSLVLTFLAGAEVDAEDVEMALPPKKSTGKVQEKSDGEGEGPLAQRVLAFERDTVLAELERHGRHITQTAKALGLERSHLYKKCQQMRIELQKLPKRD